MARLLLLAALAATLGACESRPQPGVAKGEAETASDGFPKVGTYDVIVEGPEGTKESRIFLEVSNRAAFEEHFARSDGSRCRDRQVKVGGGSFSIKMTCDAPDGDIHNIGLESFGRYSESSIDMTTETTLWGRPFQEHSSFRLREG